MISGLELELEPNWSAKNCAHAHEIQTCFFFRSCCRDTLCPVPCALSASDNRRTYSHGLFAFR
jgi:hypothetical protein